MTPDGLCFTRPADWWSPDDDGARLALLLCRACPRLNRCEDESGKEYGVIRAGVAYGDDGRVLPLCACGYPNRHRRGGTGRTNTRCHRCAVPILKRWERSRKSYWRRYYERQKARAA